MSTGINKVMIGACACGGQGVVFDPPKDGKCHTPLDESTVRAYLHYGMLREQLEESIRAERAGIDDLAGQALDDIQPTPRVQIDSFAFAMLRQRELLRKTIRDVCNQMQDRGDFQFSSMLTKLENALDLTMIK
jgi:hypothetical protein